MCLAVPGRPEDEGGTYEECRDYRWHWEIESTMVLYAPGNNLLQVHLRHSYAPAV
jgi:hypothetical protein